MSNISRSYRFRKKKKINMKRIGTLVTLLVFILMIFACMRYFSLYNTLRGSDSASVWRPDESERLQLLLMGKLDDIVTCTLLSIPGDNEAIHVLGISPRTLVSTDGQTRSLADIFEEDGVEGGISALDNLLRGKLPIHHYIIYDVLGVAEILETIKEVDVELSAGFQVHHGDTDYVFAPGEKKINADNIVPFIACSPTPDSAGFWAEKSLLVGVFNQLFSFNHISYLVTNLGTISESYCSDMSSRELARFRDTLQVLEWDNLNYLTLPGRWLYSGAEKHWSTEEKLMELTVRQILEGLTPYDRDNLIVDLYNGNGINGFAARTASQLGDKGYKIGRVSNAEETTKTLIYYSPGYRLAALEFSSLLAVDADLLEGNYGGSNNPVAIILGRDLSGGN